MVMFVDFPLIYNRSSGKENLTMLHKSKIQISVMVFGVEKPILVNRQRRGLFKGVNTPYLWVVKVMNIFVHGATKTE